MVRFVQLLFLSAVDVGLAVGIPVGLLGAAILFGVPFCITAVFRYKKHHKRKHMASRPVLQTTAVPLTSIVVPTTNSQFPTSNGGIRASYFNDV